MTPEIASSEWHKKAKQIARELGSYVAGNYLDRNLHIAVATAANLLDPPPDPEAELNSAIQRLITAVYDAARSTGVGINDQDYAHDIRVAARKLGQAPSAPVTSSDRYPNYRLLLRGIRHCTAQIRVSASDEDSARQHVFDLFTFNPELIEWISSGVEDEQIESVEKIL